MVKTILLDTSFLIACAEFKIDYFCEIQRLLDCTFKFAVLNNVFDELCALIEKGNSLQKQTARLAKTILEKKQVEVIAGQKRKKVDDILVEIASKNDIVATIDAGLKRRLKEKNISLIIIRQKKYLEMLQN